MAGSEITFRDLQPHKATALAVVRSNAASCSLCGCELTEETDAGYAVDEREGVYGFRCSPSGLCVACYPKRRREVLSASLRDIFRAARVPERFWGVTRESIAGPVWARVEGWLGSREALLIHGAVGTGKSHLAAVLARELLLGCKAVSWWSLLGLLDAMRGDLDNMAALQASVQRVPVLVLDDVGAERLTDFSGERLSALISARWDANLPTVATSNLAPDELAEANARVASRLCSGVVIGLKGRDRRLGGQK